MAATNVFKKLADSTLTASVATQYAVPSLTSTVVSEIFAINTSTTTSCTVTVYQGGTSTSNQITAPIALGPQESFRLKGPHPMAAADTIAAGASVTSIVHFTMSGNEMVAANL